MDASAHRAGLRPNAYQIYNAASLGVKWSGKYAWAAKLGWLAAPTALGPTPLAIAHWSWQAWQLARSEPARKLGRRAKARWDERRAPDPDDLAAMRDAIAARESACRAAASANRPSSGPWSQAWRPGDTWLDCLERSLENACRAADVDYWPRRDWHTADPACVELSRWTLLQAIAASGCLSFPPFFGGLVYAALASSYSIGESMPALEWRRWRLYHWSIQAATSRRAWARVG